MSYLSISRSSSPSHRCDVRCLACHVELQAISFLPFWITLLQLNHIVWIIHDNTLYWKERYTPLIYFNKHANCSAQKRMYSRSSGRLHCKTSIRLLCLQQLNSQHALAASKHTDMTAAFPNKDKWIRRDYGDVQKQISHQSLQFGQHPARIGGGRGGWNERMTTEKWRIDK